jgi:hypothetical protein
MLINFSVLFIYRLGWKPITTNWVCKNVELTKRISVNSRVLLELPLYNGVDGM